MSENKFKMMDMKCVAIDDEPMALEVISSFTQRLGKIEVKMFTNPFAGLEYVQRTKPDVLFLDVEMGDVNGLELIKELPPSTCLILTTAFAQYALDGFELNAVDFLYKPFSYSRFETAIRKAADWHSLHRLSVEPVFTDESITLKVGYRNTNVKLKDIQYIESMDNYVRFHLQGQLSLMSQISMKSVQGLLPVDKFLRVHKSFIVPKHRIAHYTSKEIVLYDGIKIPVGRNYSKELKK